MSELGRNWNIINTDKNTTPFEKVCKNKGINTQEELNNFINPSNFPHNPYLLKDIRKAIKRIKESIKNKEKIMIFGDYDVDGITSTAIMFSGLKSLGAIVSYRLPHREKDGYGLNKNFIDECKELGVKLIITVDCGIANTKEVKLAKTYDIDVIITDHHNIQKDIPDALAVINPKQTDCKHPLSETCGAVVAYKLISVLCEGNTVLLESLIEIMAIGIVADCCPLIDENRYYVKKGIDLLYNTKHKGLKKMLQNIDLIDTYTIGFFIGPRLNAAGRIASPYPSLDLLLGKPEKLELLEKFNKYRQEIVLKALDECLSQFDNNKNNIIITHSENWHIGIIGLIAGKITEKYYKPSIVMQKKGDIYVGSARSIKDIDIMSFFNKTKDMFIHFGGHKLAAGFSIQEKNLKKFKNRIESFANSEISKDLLIPVINIDCEISYKDINFALLDNINKLSPFGIKNERPRFLIRDISIANKKLLSNGKHIKFNIKDSDIDIIGFHIGTKTFSENIDLVFELNKNTWNGTTCIQLRIIDWKNN